MQQNISKNKIKFSVFLNYIHRNQKVDRKQIKQPNSFGLGKKTFNSSIDYVTYLGLKHPIICISSYLSSE